MINYLLEYNRYCNIIGIFVILGIALLFSKKRSHVNYALVFKALGLQFLLGLSILRFGLGHKILNVLAGGVQKIYEFADHGSRFVFGSLANPSGPWGFIFAIKVLPVVKLLRIMMLTMYCIFFSVSSFGKQILPIFSRKNMIKRNVEPLIARALKTSPVVLLNGACHVGKTTLALKVMKEKGYNYITFDDEITYLAAKSNWIDFLEQIEKPLIIDEIQRVPEILLAIKVDVANHCVAGRYLLTGSVNPLLISHLNDSLAGHMEMIHLLPLSQGEIAGDKEQFIDAIFSNKQFRAPKQSSTRTALYSRMVGMDSLMMLQKKA